jgi:hypothetical protein
MTPSTTRGRATVALGGIGRGGAETRAAWRAWAAGNIEECAELASSVPSPWRQHLSFLTDYVRGRYERALGHYAAIEGRHRALAELDEPVAEAWLHLDRPGEAVEHARRRRAARPRAVAAALRELLPRAERPLRVELDRPTVLPFADHELAPYLPCVTATLDGRETRAAAAGAA